MDTPPGPNRISKNKKKNETKTFQLSKRKFISGTEREFKIDIDEKNDFGESLKITKVAQSKRAGSVNRLKRDTDPAFKSWKGFSEESFTMLLQE